ncbi:hypothetical protein RQP46_007138 [Phenoliferia psychrophenolica]
MSESAGRSPGPPAIAFFAPELIDEILHHLVAACASDRPATKPLETASLISRNWRGPAQRRLMEHLTIKSGTQAKRVAEGLAASGLDVYVRNLTIDFGQKLWASPVNIIDEPTPDQISAVDGVTRDHFLALLPLFPGLTSLDLEGPPFTHFRDSDIRSLELSTIFPRLTSLHIWTRQWHRDVNLAHDILRLTPSLKTLLLTSDESDTIKSPSLKSPIELPMLENLNLIGGTYPSSLIDLNLLSTSTIAQVKDLYWSDDDSPNPSARPLLQIMGPTLKCLGYTTFDGDRDMAAELESCTALERLDLAIYNLSTAGLLASIPHTVQTLVFSDIYAARALLVDDFQSRSPTLKTVKLDMDFQHSERGGGWEYDYDDERYDFEEIADTLRDSGVELVVTGKGLLRALEQMG